MFEMVFERIVHFLLFNFFSELNYYYIIRQIGHGVYNVDVAEIK